MTERTGPLTGIRVVDMTMYVAGPLCTQMLADMGAEVIKVERPPEGDVYRRQGPEFIRGQSISFLALNKGKKSIVIDLKSGDGGRIIADLIRTADVFIHNFKPGTAERLGLGRDDVAALNPSTVWATVSGYGGAGPKGDLGGYDLMMQGECGLMEVTGYPDRPPAKAGFAVIDINAAANLAFGIVCALHERARTGVAPAVESSLYETSIAMGLILAERYLSTGAMPSRSGSASPLFSPYQAYQTEDGYFTVEGTGPPGAFERFSDAIGAPELVLRPEFATNADRVTNREALREEIERRTLTRPTDYWIERFVERSIPCGPIQTIGQALDSEQTAAVGMVVAAPHPDGGTYRTLRNPLRLGGERTQPEGPPRLGGDTFAVLRTLGYSGDDIERMVAGGAVVATGMEPA